MHATHMCRESEVLLSALFTRASFVVSASTRLRGSVWFSFVCGPRVARARRRGDHTHTCSQLQAPRGVLLVLCLALREFISCCFRNRASAECLSVLVASLALKQIIRASSNAAASWRVGLDDGVHVWLMSLLCVRGRDVTNQARILA